MTEEFNLSKCIFGEDRHCEIKAVSVEDVKEFIKRLSKGIEKLHDEQRESQGTANNPEVAMERLNKANLIFGNNGILELIDKLAGDKLI
jgi:hypothetical protein